MTCESMHAPPIKKMELDIGYVDETNEKISLAGKFHLGFQISCFLEVGIIIITY